MPLFGRRNASAAPRPATPAETMRAMRVVRERAASLFEQKDYRTAISAQLEAVELAKSIPVGAGTAHDYASLLGVLMEELCRFQAAAGDRDGARRSCRGALRYLKPWAEDAASPEATIYGAAIMWLTRLLDTPDGREELIGLRAEATRLATDRRSSDETMIRQAVALHRIAEALRAEGRVDQEIDVRRDVISAVDRSRVRNEDVEIAYADELARLAVAQAQAGRFEEAFAVARRCREFVDEPRTATTPALRNAVPVAYHGIGYSLREARRSEQSLDWLTVSDEYLAVLCDEEPARYLPARAGVWNDWAYALQDLGPDRAEEGLAKIDGALDLLGPAAAEESEEVAYVRACAFDTKADLLGGLGRSAEALPLRRRSAEILRGLPTQSPKKDRYAKDLENVERRLAADS